VAATAESAAGCVGEITPFMVIKAVRGSSLAPGLLLVALKEMVEAGIRTALGASKVGAMTQYYENYGAAIDRTCCCEYRALKHTFGSYYLTTWDLDRGHQRHFELLARDIYRLRATACHQTQENESA
jgi:hypothetical protein